MDSLMALPRSRKSCLILSSTCTPLWLHVKPCKISSLCLRALERLWQTVPPRSIFRLAAERRTLLVHVFQWLQAVGHRFPELRPIRQILPSPPLRITPEQRLIADAASLVMSLANEAAKLAIDGDEVVTAVHRQEVCCAVRSDARQLPVAFEKLLRRLG